jgi:hypothetical protein
MKMRIGLLGEEHPNTLASRNHLALMFRTQGLWKEAEELEVQVMEMLASDLARWLVAPMGLACPYAEEEA